ncbi:MAG: M20/M25/M40 family metallo-hydrolase [Holophagales bacterium]|jgi:hypothetical protein|nr:M20/M25/M40 family metallo-hydrolase [Holophagales bacterium]
MIKQAALQSFIVLAAACTASAQTTAATQTQKGEASIRGRDAVATVARLSEKDMAGRLTGQPGFTVAASWTLSQFKALGLKGQLQQYIQPHSVLDGGKMLASVKEEKLEAEILKDFFPLLFSDSGQASGGSVFVGWGIHAPELGYDDYAGIDAKGKFVVCFRGTPDNDTKWVYHDEHRTRMKVASQKGALGLIYVYPSVIAHPNGDLIPDFFASMISDAYFDKLLAIEEGTTSQELQKQLRETKKPASLNLNAHFDISVKARHFPKAQGYNAVAWLDGSDPELKSECVVIGAHLDGVGDHLGLRFPAAEDNASGSAVVLEIAKAFAKNGKRPKSSVVFALFGSEEQGGQGSAHFVANLPPQFKKMAAFINFDMVGIGTKLNIGMNNQMEQYRELLDSCDDSLSVLGNIRPIRAIGVRSGDIVPFFNKGVPLVSLSSNGPRPPDLYHLPGDTPNLVQADLMEKISKLMFRFAHGICQAD